MIKLQKIIKDVRWFLNAQVDLGKMESENYKWYCEENLLNPKHRPSRQKYVEELMGEFTETLRHISADFNNEYSDIIDEVEDYDDEWEYLEYIAKNLSHRLANPFNDTWTYMWEPIVDAMREIGLSDTGVLKDVDASVGEKLVLAFYIQGNDGPLPWAYIHDCIA